MAAGAARRVFPARTPQPWPGRRCDRCSVPLDPVPRCVAAARNNEYTIPSLTTSSGFAMPRPSVHVIIVNWNSGNQLLECLQSFAAVAADAVTLAGVTVVDNASEDGSLDAAT